MTVYQQPANLLRLECMLPNASARDALSMPSVLDSLASLLESPVQSFGLTQYVPATQNYSGTGLTATGALL